MHSLKEKPNCKKVLRVLHQIAAGDPPRLVSLIVSGFVSATEMMFIEPDDSIMPGGMGNAWGAESEVKGVFRSWGTKQERN